MTSRATIARHRGETQSFADLAKALSGNAGGMGRQAAVIAAASGLVLTSGVAANAADLQPQREVASAKLTITADRTAVRAAGTTAVAFNMTPVKVNAKPVQTAPAQPAPAAAVVAPPVVEVAAVPVAAAPVAAAPAVAAPAPAPVAAPVAVAVAAAPAAIAAPAPVVSSGVAATIAAAAQGQLGVMQDCTRLVSNSLAAAGINFHGWPAGYLSLGRSVSAGEAIPGDLIYYADGGMGMAHIAVYIGGGQAVHGGFNGNSTVIAPAELGSGGVYIRVGG